MAEENEPDTGTCLAAFLAYAAPFLFEDDPLTKTQTHFLHLARKLLCPLDKDGDIATYVLTTQDEKFVALAYSWLLRQCHDTGNFDFWEYSLFEHACQSILEASKILGSFEKKVKSVLHHGPFLNWIPPMQGIGPEKWDPTIIDGAHSGIFSHFAQNLPASPVPVLAGFRGFGQARVQAPFPGQQACLDLIVASFNPDDAEDAEIPDPQQHSEAHPAPKAVPASEVVPASAEFQFTFTAIQFSFSTDSEAGLWLRAHLPAKHLAAIKETKLLPVHLSHPPVTVKKHAPVLDIHGYPWMCADGKLITNQSEAPALRATSDQSKAFYKSGVVPITFTPSAPARVSTGYMAAQTPTALFSGKDELTEDEDEPPRESVRHNTKPRSPPPFSGQQGSLDFITWCREVDNWYTIDTHQLHERAAHAASYLSGPAAEYWRHLKPHVLEWYVSHLPGRYISPDNQPYIPWTAMKKIMAEEYAGYDKLEQLRGTLKTLKRKPSQSAAMYNTSFRMLVADIATFGSRQVSADSELIGFYLDNCDFKIPKLQQNPFTLQTAPWGNLDELMRQGIMEGSKQQSHQHLNSMQPSSDGTGRAGGKHASNERGKGSKRARSKPSSSAASITAHQENLLASLLASFKAATGHQSEASTSRGQRGPFPQRGILKRAKFNTPPPPTQAGTSSGNQAGTSSGNQVGTSSGNRGGGRPMCSYQPCGKPGHTFAQCFKRQNDEAASEGRPIPYPPEYFQKGKH
jgi:hypothetical protein